MDKTEINKIKELISPIIGLRAWGISLGQGSFITIEFGEALQPDKKTGIQHGQWHLWIYNSSWRIENENNVLVGSEDSREKIKNEIKKLENLPLKNIDFLLPSMDTTFEFENSIKIRAIPLIFHEDYDYWILYMPNDKTLSLHSGPSWIIE